MASMFVGDASAPPKSMKDILLDSLFVGLIAFFASLMATVATNSLPNAVNVYVALLAFGTAFVAQVIKERGINSSPSPAPAPNPAPSS